MLLVMAAFADQRSVCASDGILKHWREAIAMLEGLRRKHARRAKER